ncbi:MAG: phosphatidylglycerol lysyltransferase domain-containing protein [Clostridia bacterium]|nr:phosphatidylglycerol lysyltransferase domain-containing protein [Clostridia bacterium]
MLEKNFENATAEDLEELKRYFAGYEYRSSGHTYSSMFMWGPEYDVSWQVIEGYLWTISSYVNEKGEKVLYSTMPLTLNTYDKDNFALSIKKVKEKMGKLVMYQVPNHMVDFIRKAWDGPIKVIEDRDSADYVYRREKLENLPGRALHKKKNNLNAFIKNYDFVAEDLREEDVPEAIDFALSFNEDKETKTRQDASVLEKESLAITRALENRDLYIVRVIKLEGKIKALAIGALYSEKEAVEHIEKADPTIRGLFQAINQDFVKRLPKEVELINREEDMGIENLRKAKGEYQPALMYEKSTVVVI